MFGLQYGVKGLLFGPCCLLKLYHDRYENSIA